MEQVYILKEPIKQIKQSEDLFKRIKKFRIDYKQENFIVIYLNTKLQIIKADNLFKGGVDACLIDPKTIFRNALKNNSSKIIIAHNHPTGDLTPSYEDREIFDKLKEIGDILDIKVIDSLTFSKKEFYSLRN